MSLPLEFVLHGSPVSQQTKRRQRLTEWKRDVRIAARQHWRMAPPFPGEVMVSITYFFTDTAPDVDNVPKPILDALKELIYADDSQVSDLFSSKRDIYRVLRVRNPTLLGPLQTSEPFLHVKVAEAPSQEVAC